MTKKVSKEVFTRLFRTEAIITGSLNGLNMTFTEADNTARSLPRQTPAFERQQNRCGSYHRAPTSPQTPLLTAHFAVVAIIIAACYVG